MIDILHRAVAALPHRRRTQNGLPHSVFPGFLAENNGVFGDAYTFLTVGLKRLRVSIY